MRPRACRAKDQIKGQWGLISQMDHLRGDLGDLNALVQGNVLGAQVLSQKPCRARRQFLQRLCALKYRYLGLAPCGAQAVRHGHGDLNPRNSAADKGDARRIGRLG